MGERQGDRGLLGRTPDAGLPDRLAAALRPAHIDPERERRAVAAFRAAREAGPHRARNRRRYDWRPRAARRPRLSVRATLSVLLASLMLGGVAFAAIDSADHGAGDGHEVRPSPTAPERPGTTKGRNGDTYKPGTSSMAGKPAKQNKGNKGNKSGKAKKSKKAGKAGKAAKPKKAKKTKTTQKDQVKKAKKAKKVHGPEKPG
ncbi:hypothetical protein [Streptomyces sp. NPDC006739]|uniref:hypothetical protein n=1 Tax=Streptomyces sp. NPDC006739 TaxID=3364763 RepID=UPI00369B41D2